MLVVGVVVVRRREQHLAFGGVGDVQHGAGVEEAEGLYFFGVVVVVG